MGKCKIVWGEGLKEKFEKAVEEHFDNLDKKKLEMCLKIMLNNSK